MASLKNKQGPPSNPMGRRGTVRSSISGSESVRQRGSLTEHHHIPEARDVSKSTAENDTKRSADDTALSTDPANRFPGINLEQGGSTDNNNNNNNNKVKRSRIRERADWILGPPSSKPSEDADANYSKEYRDYLEARKKAREIEEEKKVEKDSRFFLTMLSTLTPDEVQTLRWGDDLSGTTIREDDERLWFDCMLKIVDTPGMIPPEEWTQSTWHKRLDTVYRMVDDQVKVISDFWEGETEDEIEGQVACWADNLFDDLKVFEQERKSAAEEEYTEP